MIDAEANRTLQFTGLDSGSFYPFLVWTAFATVVAGVFMIVPWVVAPARVDLEKSSAYECGFDAFGEVRGSRLLRLFGVCWPGSWTAALREGHGGMAQGCGTEPQGCSCMPMSVGCCLLQSIRIGWGWIEAGRLSSLAYSWPVDCRHPSPVFGQTPALLSSHARGLLSSSHAQARSTFSVSFYLVSIMYLLFDIEIAYLFPYVMTHASTPMFW